MRSYGLRRRFALLSRRGPTAAVLVVAPLVAAPLVVAASVLGAGIATSDGALPGPPPPTARQTAFDSARAAAVPVRPPRPAVTSVMQIVAHPDDDLFFMNPDTHQSVVSGSRLTSVYLTAGESDGVNAARTGPLAPATRPGADKERYAEARQNGIRAAYAEMATGDRTSPWRRTALHTAGGAMAEVDILVARPSVNLVWVQLREAGSIHGDRPHSLHGLWDGRTDRLRSQPASGSPAAEDFAYSRQQVVDTVTGLLERYAPTHVRILDPTPGLVPSTGHPSDHQDHTYAARFTQAALARYAAMPDHPAFSVQSYLGYATSGLPGTLDPHTAAAKLDIVRTYAWMDDEYHCGDLLAGCGDRKVAARPEGRGWTNTVRHTRGESTSWVRRDADGGTWAFSVLDTRLAVWHRPAGGTWSGPELLPGAGLDSGVSSVRLPDGRIAVLATRTTLGDGPGGYRRDVVTAVQSAPGGDFGPWESLGMPERDEDSGVFDFSAPAAAVDRAGRITVYLRNARHSLSSLAQRTDGTWEPSWRERGGRDLHGDPAVASDAHGRQQVFVGTPRSVVTWTQARPGAPLRGPVPTGLPPTTLALSAAPDGDGVRLWFRRPASGAVRTALFSGSSASPVTELGGPAGFGPVGAFGPGLSVPAVRSGTGTPGVALPGTGTAGRTAVPPRWESSGPLFAGAPAGADTGVGAVGLDGRLYWSATDGGGWQPVG
ncbi:PIG-L family deacetylase [Streptomyces sp. NPDC003023]|uniref:PIG-L family deacetylase n=1 Tax=Streptomyces sp. NPDC003023 TaxID=3364675 RepID=UPI003680F0D7